jgi:hypothetical protein
MQTSQKKSLQKNRTMITNGNKLALKSATNQNGNNFKKQSQKINKYAVKIDAKKRRKP